MITFKNVVTFETRLYMSLTKMYKERDMYILIRPCTNTIRSRHIYYSDI